jgi:hypothetical protein
MPLKSEIEQMKLQKRKATKASFGGKTVIGSVLGTDQPDSPRQRVSIASACAHPQGAARCEPSITGLPAVS